MSKLNQFSILTMLLMLHGCSEVSNTAGPLTGIDGVLCIGEIATPPSGIVESSSTELLNDVLKKSTEGGLCAGKEFYTEKPVTVYRVWDSEKNNAYGDWWTFELPTVSRLEYRKEEDICQAWSSLDRLVQCEIVVGTTIAIGVGQSAQCGNTSYAKSSANQVYIPNSSQTVFVANCDKSVVWPQ